jgi:four helix bundle protein
MKTPEKRRTGTRIQKSEFRIQNEDAAEERDRNEKPESRSKTPAKSATEDRIQNRGVRMRTPATTFEDLLVWQKAHQFVLAAYRLSRTFPRTETYGLASQLRRAAVSIAANIAEGFKKRGRADKLRFFNIAQGSIEESRYYLILARDLDYGDVSESSKLLDEVSKLLDGYSHAILTSGT